MTTSGVYTETRSAKKIIDDALWELRAQDAETTAGSNETSRCIRALNDVLNQLQGPPANYTGFKMWQRESVTLTYVANYHYYVFNPGVSTTNNINAQVPLEIIGVKNRETSSSDETPMSDMTFQEYLAVGNKTDEGLPDRYYYENRGATGRIYFNREPSSDSISGYKAIIEYRQPIEIIVAENNTVDAPSHWIRALKWALAKELSPAYGGLREDIAMLAMESIKLAISFDAENVVAYYEPEREL